jgi:hypothetical protein
MNSVIVGEPLAPELAAACVRDRVEQQGFAIVPSGLSQGTIESLRQQLAEVSGDGPGLRNLLTIVPAIRDLAQSPNLRAPVDGILGTQAQLVRGLFFDKTPAANWKVPWHQDVTIALADRVDLDPEAYPDYGPWSLKAGVHHIQPPVAILDQLLTVRLHLDRADGSNGALRLLPGSHRSGRLSAEAIRDWRSRVAEVCAVAEVGDLLVMRPLLLHASSAAANPVHRRVIHLDYAIAELPAPLRWYESISASLQTPGVFKTPDV